MVPFVFNPEEAPQEASPKLYMNGNEAFPFTFDCGQVSREAPRTMKNERKRFISFHSSRAEASREACPQLKMKGN